MHQPGTLFDPFRVKVRIRVRVRVRAQPGTLLDPRNDDSIWAAPPAKADFEEAGQLLDKFGELFFSFDTNLNGTLERAEVAKLLRKYHAMDGGFARPLKAATPRISP